jgi:hypothetical protein
MSLKDLKKEVAYFGECECEKPDPKLLASLELLAVLNRLLDNLMYSGLVGLDEDTIMSRRPVIAMQIGFVRDAVSMLEPALRTLEEYLSYTESDSGGDD